MQTLLAMLPRDHHEDDEKYHKRIDEIQSQMQPFVAPSDQTLFFIRFCQRNQVHMVNQVCPSGTTEVVKAQGENSDVQRMIRILNVQETPPPKPSELYEYLLSKTFQNL